MIRFRSQLVALIGLFATCAVSGADRSAELVTKIPRDANAVFIVRVQDILKTDRAQREDWTARQTEKFLAGQTAVPPWVETLVVGSLVRPSIPENAWSAALAVVPPQAGIDSIASHEQVEPELLGGKRSVRSKRDVVFVELEPNLIGAMSPAHRQEVARWIRETTAGDATEVSRYLVEAGQIPGHIVLAMDLKDALDPTRVRARLQSDEALSQSAALRMQLSNLLLGLQGVSMAIHVGDEITSEVVFQFSGPLGDTGAILHQVFLQVIGEMGVGIEEFDAATVEVRNDQLVLRSTLSEESLRRILSLIIPPPPSIAEPPMTAQAPATTPPTTTIAPNPAAGQPKPAYEASRRYLQSVNGFIDDLKAANNRAKTYERTATWHENFARKIDNLPTAGVDKDLLAYGASVADKFRALAASLRGQAVQVQAAQNALTVGYSYDPGWAEFNVWGGVGYQPPTTTIDTNLRAVRESQAAAVAAGADDRIKVWNLIDDERATIERQLRERYGDGFFDDKRRR